MWRTYSKVDTLHRGNGNILIPLNGHCHKMTYVYLFPVSHGLWTCNEIYLEPWGPECWTELRQEVPKTTLACLPVTRLTDRAVWPGSPTPHMLFHTWWSTDSLINHTLWRNVNINNPLWLLPTAYLITDQALNIITKSITLHAVYLCLFRTHALILTSRVEQDPLLRC